MKFKTVYPPVSSKKQKGGRSMDGEDQFRELFQRIVELYQLSPEIAAELLQRILAILAGESDEDPVS